MTDGAVIGTTAVGVSGQRHVCPPLAEHSPTSQRRRHLMSAACLVIVCAIPVLFVVGGVYAISRFFGSSEAEEWERFDDLPE